MTSPALDDEQPAGGQVGDLVGEVPPHMPADGVPVR
jgi:hypothetical protein